VLKSVITYRRRRAQSALYVAGLQEISLLRRFCPNAGETISLQLKSDRERIL
jgi:ribosomal protein S27AE